MLLKTKSATLNKSLFMQHEQDKFSMKIFPKTVLKLLRIVLQTIYTTPVVIMLHE